MPQGVRVKDKNGAIVLDLNDRITRVVGTASTGTSAGSLNVPGGTSVWIFINEVSRTNNNVSLPIFSISGSAISWTFNPSQGQTNTSVTFIYGLY